MALLLGRLRDGLLARGGLVGIYLYGSLVTGDFSPARSDIDVVVMVEREPDKAAVKKLRRLHESLAGGAMVRWFGSAGFGRYVARWLCGGS